MTGQIQREIDR